MLFLHPKDFAGTLVELEAGMTRRRLGIVLFAVIWFVALLVALPIGLTTQGEAGEVVPGTPASAPVDAMIRRKLVWVTLATLAIWAPLSAFILWGGVSVARHRRLRPDARPRDCEPGRRPTVLGFRPHETAAELPHEDTDRTS